MDTARIAALLEPFLEQPLPQSQLDQISIYIDLLLRWNARINLTAIRHEEEIVTRHFGESFFLARHLFPASVARTLLSATADTTGQPAIPQFPKPCHPERSQDIREAMSWRSRRTPTPSSTARAAAGNSPAHLASSPRPRHRFRRRIPRPAPEALGAAHPPHADRIESQKSRLPPRSSPSTYIDQHQCINRPSPDPRPEPHLPSRRSNPPSRRALGNRPPSSPNLPSPKRNPSPTNNHPPDPPSVGPNEPELASQNKCPKVTFKGITNWIQGLK